MEMKTLEPKERKVLLNLLDFDKDKLKCQECGKECNYQDCCIMPPIETKLKATILCVSPLCLAEYFTKIENEKEGKK